MQFCPKCGSILRPKQEKSKKVMYCSCGYVDRQAEAVTIKESIKQEKGIEVVDPGIDDARLPITEDFECPKCGHKKARYWLVQTRAADEPETKFLKCDKCKNIVRDYN